MSEASGRNERRIRLLTAAVVVLGLVVAFETGWLLRTRAERPAESERRDYPVALKGAAARPASAPAARPAPRAQASALWTDPWADSFPSADDWDPFGEMERMQGLMDRLFSDSLARARTSGAVPGGGFYRPDLDFTEGKDEYVVRLDLPGLDKDKIDVKVRAGALTISGERSSEADAGEGGMRRIERSYGSFVRSIPLPADADTVRMTAEAKEGVLTVRIPKRSGTPESARRVAVT